MTPRDQTRPERPRPGSSQPRHLVDSMIGSDKDTSLSRRALLAGVGQVAGSAAIAGVASGVVAQAQASAMSASGAAGAWQTASGHTQVSPTASMPELQPASHVQAVVSAYDQATSAGVATLAAGGTAADAAIAVAAVLSVVEPWFSSVLGGGTWALYYDAESGQVTSLDGVGPAGSNATLADYAGRVDVHGIHQAILPGAWDGWMLWLDRFGQLDLGQVLDPAIRIASDGYPVSADMAYWLGLQADFIATHPDTARTYVAQGFLPGEGDLIRQPELAATFEALVQVYDAAAGNSRTEAVQAARDYFYRGPLAEAIVAVSDRDGGYLTLEDFQAFEAQIVEPIAIDFDDDITVFQNPPNSQGIAMLLALNILKGYDFSEQGIYDPDNMHLQVEAMKLAFADRHWYVGDPDRIEIPLAELLSDEHAARQRDRINLDQALVWPIAGGLDEPNPTHTTTFHVIDQYGNAAAVTTSLGGQFLLIGDTGIHINERMQFHSLEPGNANELTPGFKVRHTSNPYMALRQNRPFILGGNSGVDTQPQGQVQQFLDVVAFGLSAQETIDEPRFVSTTFPASSYPYAVGNQLQLEAGFPDSLIQELIARGHDVVVGEGIFGAANMIVVDEDGGDAQTGAESRFLTAFGYVVPAAE